ncbi:MAG: VacJ family lipoprotein [Pseudomonadota bacterium]
MTDVMKKLLPLVATLLLATACSTKNAEDPLEPYNRGMFQFNQAVDSYLLRPVAKGYRYVTPDGIRSRIGNASDNLYEPVSMVNNFLQGDFTGGMNNFFRFMINSTIGLAGLNDVATSAGIPARQEDFGQTLAVWGVGSGPYIVLPLLGPSNLRDTGGMVGNWFLDPLTYAVDDTWTMVGIRTGQAVIMRERLLDPIDDVYSSSLDPYASFRSIYNQRRAAQIKNLHSSNKPAL